MPKKSEDVFPDFRAEEPGTDRSDSSRNFYGWSWYLQSRAAHYQQTNYDQNIGWMELPADTKMHDLRHGTPPWTLANHEYFAAKPRTINHYLNHGEAYSHTAVVIGQKEVNWQLPPAVSTHTVYDAWGRKVSQYSGSLYGGGHIQKKTINRQRDYDLSSLEQKLAVEDSANFYRFLCAYAGELQQALLPMHDGVTLYKMNRPRVCFDMPKPPFDQWPDIKNGLFDKAMAYDCTDEGTDDVLNAETVDVNDHLTEIRQAITVMECFRVNLGFVNDKEVQEKLQKTYYGISTIDHIYGHSLSQEEIDEECCVHISNGKIPYTKIAAFSPKYPHLHKRVEKLNVV